MGGRETLDTKLSYHSLMLSNWREETWKSQGPFHKCFSRFIYTSHHFTPHGRYELNKLTSLLMCGVIAQLAEHRTGIAEVTGSNLIFRASFFQLLNELRWSLFTFIFNRSSNMNYFMNSSHRSLTWQHETKRGPDTDTIIRQITTCWPVLTDLECISLDDYREVLLSFSGIKSIRVFRGESRSLNSFFPLLLWLNPRAGKGMTMNDQNTAFSIKKQKNVHCITFGSVHLVTICYLQAETLVQPSES